MKIDPKSDFPKANSFAQSKCSGNFLKKKHALKMKKKTHETRKTLSYCEKDMKLEQVFPVLRLLDHVLRRLLIMLRYRVIA